MPNLCGATRRRFSAIQEKPQGGGNQPPGRARVKIVMKVLYQPVRRMDVAMKLPSRNFENFENFENAAKFWQNF